MICLVSVSFEQKRDIFGLLQSVDIMILRLTNLFLLLAASAGAQSIMNIIPADRLPALGYWTPGVPGGIDQYSANYSQFCNVKVFIPGTNIVVCGGGIGTLCSIGIS